MRSIRPYSLATFCAAGLFVCQQVTVQAQMPDMAERSSMNLHESGAAADESKDVQMARALAAGPRTVIDKAKVIGTDPQGKTVVLREGTNGFTCQPGNPKVAGRPASCANAAAIQWSEDLAVGKPNPTNTAAGFVYMLAGATGTSGPEWMILWPFDPKTAGLSAARKAAGAFILWSGTPYAHLHILGQPVGPPGAHLASEHASHMAAMSVTEDAPGGAAGANETAEVQIARAIGAGPKNVTDGAQILGTNAEGKRVVLREGDNGFVCRAGSLRVVADPPQCSSTKSKPMITYMLGGATQRSISDPDDKTSPSLAIGPHWMIMMRFDPRTSGIPETYSDTGAYLMWSESRIGHMHIMGIP